MIGLSTKLDAVSSSCFFRMASAATAPGDTILFRRALLIQCIPNHIQNRIDIVHNIVIPKPQDLISFGFQKLSSFYIVLF
jgi:hypothetical protein